MKRTHWLSILLLVSVFSYLSIGCDDDVKKKTNNDNVNNANNATCGNNILETGETCDGTALGGEDCTTVEGDFTGGTLACAAGCTAFDTTGCTTGCSDACELDNRVCSGDTLRVCVADTETGCTVWSDTDCTLTSETCQVIETVAQCAACEDECTLDAEQCNANDDGIEACVLGASGCTEWQNAACPQATPLCELQAGEPTCVADCEDACTLDVKQCNTANDGIETCVTGAQGCTEWQNAPCDVATPECQDLAGVATCMAPNGSGETCADVFTITIPFYTEGTDFTADFLAADMTLDGTGCDLGASGVDAVFAVDLVQDEAIIFAQGGGLDGVIYIQAICDAAGECLDAADDVYSNQTEALLFAAPADGTYYLIAKSYSASPSTVAYAIAVWHYEDPAELTCDDGFDNDLDDLVDCGDPDCFGVGPCTTETLCGDGEDNDADTDFDCADTDCAGVEPCGTEDTEARCADGVDNDVDGLVDCDETACQGFIACMAGHTCENPIVITTTPFNVTGTDWYADHPINRNYQNSAGGCGTTGSGPEAVFAIDLAAGERITMPETGDFDALIRVMSTCTDTTPTCLYRSDDPDTGYAFTAPAAGTYYIVLEAYYASDTETGYNFTVNRIPMTEISCTDAVDNDLDTKVDCNDTDCFGQTGCTAAELNCSDGGDNDGDGDVDCDDTDCATFPACLGGDSCADALPVTLPFNATGTDITADFTNAQTFTGTGCGTGNGVEAVFTVSLTAGQRIKLDETGTLDAVIRVVQPCANTTTCLLSQDTTETNLVFTAPADGVYYVVLEAYSSAPGTTVRGYNFSIINWDVTETVCTDTLDDDLDGLVDCNDPDCFGQTGCTTELNCVDGFDNDDDGDADCDDIDCAAATACELGESCINPTVVTTFPFNVTGTNFGADFANDHTFSSATCTVTGGAEALFAVDLLAGERLRLNETGTSFDAQLRVLPACTTTAPVCLVNSDPETNILFTAPAAGTYYVVLESYYSTSTSAYNFTIEKFPGTETNCTDTIDNDADGVIDCADSDCYGVGSCPTLLFSENFNTWPLVGWTIVDGGTSTHTWTSSAIGTARPLTGATGLYAKVDSDAAGSGPTLDENLVSPVINCTGFTTVNLSFRHYYYHSSGQTAQVDVSTDSGANWVNVASYTTSSTNGAIANINISAQAANQAAVQIRWHYTGSYDWYWLVDDVTVTGL